MSTVRAGRYAGGLRLLAGVSLAVSLLGGHAAQAQEDVPVVEAGYGEDVEARLQKLERTLQGRGLLDLANQVESLQQEVQRLRGELEEQQHVIEQLQSNPAPAAAAAPAAPDPRWPTPGTEVPSAAANVAPGAASPATVPQVPATPAPPTAPAAVPPVAAAQPPAAAIPPATDPDQAYSAAFNALKAGQYQDAIAQFNNFLVTYPDSERADSAQYWLGEAYYVSRQYDPAINEYQKLLAAYPKSQKVSQAMLKIGFCQQELGQRDAARATLQEVLQRFPGTTSARMAEDRLQRMRLEQAP